MSEHETAARELERAERNTARVASQIEVALEFFRTARDVSRAAEYRDDLADLLAAIDDWRNAEARYYETMRPVPQSSSVSPSTVREGR